MKKLFVITAIIAIAAKTTFAQYGEDPSRRKVVRVVDNVYGNLTTKDCEDCLDKASIKTKIVIGVLNTYIDSLHLPYPHVNEGNLLAFLEKFAVLVWGNDVAGQIYVWKVIDNKFKPEQETAQSGEMFLGIGHNVFIKVDGPLNRPRPEVVFNTNAVPAEKPKPIARVEAPVADQAPLPKLAPAPDPVKTETARLPKTDGIVNFNNGGDVNITVETPSGNYAEHQAYQNRSSCMGVDVPIPWQQLSGNYYSNYPRYSFNGGWYYYNNGWYCCATGILVDRWLHGSLCNAFGVPNAMANNNHGYDQPHPVSAGGPRNTGGSHNGGGHH